MADLKLLQAGASELGIELTRKQLAAFSLYMNELLKWNQRANLTAITTSDGIQIKHFLDSLTCLLAFPGVERGVPGAAPLSGASDRLGDGSGLSCLDVGTGPGFPGVPLKILLPGMRLTLLESIGKKTAFLASLVDQLGLEDVLISSVRAEDLARQPEHREKYDVVVARALARMPTLAELALPFCRVGGRMIALKKGDQMAGEIEEGQYAVHLLGGSYLEEIAVDLSLLDGGRILVVLEKATPTPPAYPRRAGMPAKRPLVARE